MRWTVEEVLMFESVAQAPRSRRGRALFFAVSGTVHGVALAAFIVAAMWRVDKLTTERHHGPIAMLPEPPPGNSGGGRATPPPPTAHPRRHKRVVRTPIQPVAVQVHQEARIEQPSDGSAPGDGGGGDGKGSGAMTLGSGCLAPPCGDGTGVDKLPEIEIPKLDVPPVVSEHDIRVLRISGDDQVQPPDTVKLQMQRDGRARVIASFKVCLDAGGAVTRVERLHSTGYAAYDARLDQAIHGWRYKAYTDGDRAIAVCSAVTFVYSMK
jgi:hypothetical protein